MRHRESERVRTPPPGGEFNEVRAKLQSLIDRRALTMSFQPIVDLRHGEMAGYEALTRPNSASGFAHPGELFDSAKDHGQLWPLEKLTRQLSFDACTAWSDQVRLFLNCTPEVFADERFASEIIHAVRQAPGLTPDRFVLEITERSDTQLVEGLDRQVRLLRERGFQIAIDDVGAGTSGLNRIMHLRPHWLKLDIELITDIDRDRVKQNLVKFLLHFAHLSGVRVVAEGIERHDELSTLIRIGVRFGQGFLLARPAPEPPQLSESIIAFMRDEWSAVHDVRRRDPRLVEIARFATPVEQFGPATPVRDGASALARDAHMPGVALVRDGRFVGWCGRQSVLTAARTGMRMSPLAELAGANTTSVPIESTVAEALDIAASRDEHSVAEPLIVTDDGKVVGAMGVRELLHAAGAVVGAACQHSSTLLQLPGRVQADQHLDRLIESARNGSPLGIHAALIDIQNCSAYNERFGYDLGNELIERLALVIEQSVANLAGRFFLAHLGDDRFLVTGPDDELGLRINEIVTNYEDRTASMRGISSAMGDDPGDERPLFGLRVLVITGAFKNATSARWVYAQADRLRAEQDSPTGRCRLEHSGGSLILRAA